MGPSLLLGGAGFIGTELARQLARAGEEVRIADVQPSGAFPERWRRADVRDFDAVCGALAGVETLFLLAAEHGLEPRPVQRFEEVNVGGARAVVAAARATGLRRIVFTSTVAVYGNRGTVANEDAPCRPTTDYGRTKLAAEELLRSWAHEDPARQLVIIRPTVVFGPGVRGRMRALFHQLARPGFRLVGTGANRKSFAHVENVAAFHRHVVALGPGTHLFNYADAPDLAMSEVTAAIREALDLPPATPGRSLGMTLLRAWMARVAAVLGMGGSEWTVGQLRAFVAESQFPSRRTAATGFVAPLSLPDALARYARSDLRWTAKVAVEVDHASSAMEHDATAA